MKARAPSPLPQHGTIGVTAPSSPVNSEKLNRGVRYLDQLGYRVEVGKSCYQQENYVAGSDKARATELMEFFQSSEIDAIFCARGGYGSLRILPYLDFDMIRKNPKLLVGFSDITALQWAIWKKSRLISLSAGMVATDMGANSVNATFESHFWNLLDKGSSNIQLDYTSEDHQIVRGTLLPGTLSVGLRLLGSSYFPTDQDLIPVLEDIDEPPHKFEGHLLQLKFASFFKKSSSVLFGHITRPEHEEYQDHPSYEKIINYVFEDLKIPVIPGLRYGHIPQKFPLPVGAPISLYLGSQSKLSIKDIYNRS